MEDVADLLDRFRHGPDILAAMIIRPAEGELDFAPAPDKWSIRQILSHVADTEIVASMQFRKILAEDRPALPTFNQEAWARALGYEKRRSADVLETFARARTDNYELMKGASAEAFARVGLHPKRGEVTLGGQLELFTSHTEKHAEQIRTRRSEFKHARAVEA